MEMTFKKSTRPFSFCSNPYGALSRDHAEEKIAYYTQKTKKCLGMAEGHRLLKIGHQAGAFERYPKDPGAISIDTADILDLMKMSFEDYRLDGIEIDIQIDQNNIIDENVRDIYVVHNKLDFHLMPYATGYLKRNTLRNVLKGFLDAKYHEKDKYMYIEIKCHVAKKLDIRDKAAISGALNVIDDVLKGFSSEEAEEIRKHIGFASFNNKALERIAELAKGRHALFFIVASNKALGWIATKTIYPHLNYLGKRLKKILLESQFLTGIWFDPCAVKDFGRIFNAINRERQGNPLLQPLKVYVSTYLLEEREYFSRLEKDREKLYHAGGLFFDIKG